MTDRTPCLGLPLLAAGQAQKQPFHNESLILLDAVAAGAVQSAGANHPPAAPSAGACWIVGPAPDGDWAGQAGALAIASDGGWRFVAARPGMRLWVLDRGLTARFDAGAWRYGDEHAAQVTISGTKVLGDQQPAVAAPTGGATVDTEGRAALNGVLAALRAHGLIAP